MVIEICGQPLLRPDYVGAVPDKMFLKLLGKARDLRHAKGFGDIAFDKIVEIASDFDPSRERVLHSLIDEAELDEIVLSAVQQLRSPDSEVRRLAAQFSSGLAGNLAPGKRLELVDKTSGDKPLPEGLGTGLRSGGILYRGDVAILSGLKGGRLQIGGNVGRIDHCERGLVFIKGNLVTLGDTRSCGVIVSGRIDSVEGDDVARVAMAVDGPQHPTITVFKRLSRWGLVEDIDGKLGALKTTLARQTDREVQALDVELIELHRRIQQVKFRQGSLNSRLTRIDALG